jgi:hypothetical protein
MTEETKPIRKKASKPSLSPVERSLKYYRDLGLECQKVERWQSFFGRKGAGKGPGGVRIDLFGVIDIVAMGHFMNGVESIFGIQCCGTSFAEHVTKMVEEPRAKRWIECGGRLILIGWVKKKDGTARLHYVPRIKEFNIDDFRKDPF